MITSLALFALATIGFANIVAHGTILDDQHLGLRGWLQRRLGRFGDGLTCPECMSWWGGLFMGMALFSTSPLVCVPCAFAGAGLMHAYLTLVNWVESKTDFFFPDGHEHEPVEE